MNHDANTLHRSETNGGDRKTFPKSETRNFDPTYGQTACNKRFRKSFDGPIIPVGASFAKDRSRFHQVSHKMLKRILSGNVLRAGRMFR